MDVDWHELVMTAARGVLVYALMLVVIRLLGKRTVGNFTAFDLLVALMLGEVVDEIIYGDVTLAQGITAIVVVALAKFATAWLSSFGHGFEKVLEGKPREIIRHGVLDRAALRSEMMNEREAVAALRLHGISDLRQVRSAILEVDGQVSVILEPWAEPLQKGDVLAEEPRQEAERPGGGTDPNEMRTDSPRALGSAS